MVRPLVEAGPAVALDDPLPLPTTEDVPPVVTPHAPTLPATPLFAATEATATAIAADPETVGSVPVVVAPTEVEDEDPCTIATLLVL